MKEVEFTIELYKIGTSTRRLDNDQLFPVRGILRRRNFDNDCLVFYCNVNGDVVTDVDVRLESGKELKPDLERRIVEELREEIHERAMDLAGEL